MAFGHRYIRKVVKSNSPKWNLKGFILGFVWFDFPINNVRTEGPHMQWPKAIADSKQPWKGCWEVTYLYIYIFIFNYHPFRNNNCIRERSSLIHYYCSSFLPQQYLKPFWGILLGIFDSLFILYTGNEVPLLEYSRESSIPEEYEKGLRASKDRLEKVVVHPNLRLDSFSFLPNRALRIWRNKMTHIGVILFRWNGLLKIHLHVFSLQNDPHRGHFGGGFNRTFWCYSFPKPILFVSLSNNLISTGDCVTIKIAQF